MSCGDVPLTNNREWNLRDAAWGACVLFGISAKHLIELQVERDDDVDGGGWWVPMWIFVPAGKSQREAPATMTQDTGRPYCDRCKKRRLSWQTLAMVSIGVGPAQRIEENTTSWVCEKCFAELRVHWISFFGRTTRVDSDDATE